MVMSYLHKSLKLKFKSLIKMIHLHLCARICFAVYVCVCVRAHMYVEFILEPI